MFAEILGMLHHICTLMHITYIHLCSVPTGFCTMHVLCWVCIVVSVNVSQTPQSDQKLNKTSMKHTSTQRHQNKGSKFQGNKKKELHESGFGWLQHLAQNRSHMLSRRITHAGMVAALKVCQWECCLLQGRLVCGKPSNPCVVHVQSGWQ